MDDIGLLVIDIKPGVITNLMSSINLDDNQKIFLVSPDGRVISDKGDMGKTSDLIAQDFFKTIIAGTESKGSDNISFEGINYLMTYYKVSNTGYTLLGLIPESALNAAARQVILTTVIMIILAALIAFGTGMFMANSMSRTINRIINASGNAASGDLSVSINSRRQDELGTLAISINEMISNMRGII